MAKRLKAMGNPRYQRDGGPASGPGFGVTLHHDKLTEPLSWRKPRRVFVNSMSDLFHEDVPPSFIAQVWQVMAETPQHTYQILTKRPERMLEEALLWRDSPIYDGLPSVLPNVHLGASVENQRWADIRVPLLLETPAAVHFVSLEPMLGPVDIDRYLATTVISRDPRYNANSPTLDWVIAGGESAGPPERALVERCECEACDGSGFASAFCGPEIGYESVPCLHCDNRGTRWDPKPEALDWVRSLRRQCVAAGVPFFFKAWGGPTPKSAGRLLDGRTWDETPGAEVRV
jgi:protein gp37